MQQNMNAAPRMQPEYDLATFAPRPERRREELRVVKTPKKKGLLRRLPVSMQTLSLMLMGALMAGLMLSVLFSQTKVTELTGDIQTQQQLLVELQSEYAYLSNEMEMKANITQVEQYAQDQLGLVKLDQSQIIYVSGKAENSVTRTKTGFGRFADELSSGLLSIMSYFTS